MQSRPIILEKEKAEKHDIFIEGIEVEGVRGGQDKNHQKLEVLQVTTTFCIQYMINEMRRRQWPFAKTFF